MRLQLDGTETRSDIHEAIAYLADLKRFIPNWQARRLIDMQIDELLDAELDINQREFLREYEPELRPTWRPGDC